MNVYQFNLQDFSTVFVLAPDFMSAVSAFNANAAQAGTNPACVSIAQLKGMVITYVAPPPDPNAPQAPAEPMPTIVGAQKVPPQ